VAEEEIDEMFDVADHDRDGIIGYKEFMVGSQVHKFSIQLPDHAEPTQDFQKCPEGTQGEPSSADRTEEKSDED
jgi:Ca2+-binding EF-hand superfamily protein